MLCPQRSLRTSLVLFVLILALFLFSVSRLGHGSVSSQAAQLPQLAGEWVKVLGQTVSGSSSSSSSTTTTASSSAPSDDKCAKTTLEFVRRPALDLSTTILYTRICIHPTTDTSPSTLDRHHVSNITTTPTTPFLPPFIPIDLTDPCPDKLPLPPCTPLSLPVPPPYPTPKQNQYTHLLFGIASSYDRILSFLPALTHFLAHTGAPLLIIISDALRLPPHQSLETLQATFRSAGIQATLLPPPLTNPIPTDHTTNSEQTTTGTPAPVEQLHFMLIRTLLSHITPQTHWLSLLDDDTFFPSIHTLSTTLATHDHTLPQWLGALSDNLGSVKAWGFMAYGGAGIFLSIPLARQLDPHMETCIAESTLPSGDGILRDCIYTHTTTKLTLVPGLYQHDIRGDPSGFYESGPTPLVSVHHWRSWYKVNLPAMAAVTRVCGDCFLKRWRVFSSPSPSSSNRARQITRRNKKEERDGDDRGGGGREDGEEEEEKERERDDDRERERERENNEDKKEKGIVFTNGYSIVQYPAPLLHTLDLDRVEGTWEYPDDSYDFVYGPFRQKLGWEEKKSFRLVDAGWVDDGNSEKKEREGENGGGGESGTFRQVYVHKGREVMDGDGDEGRVDEKPPDEVVEVYWA